MSVRPDVDIYIPPPLATTASLLPAPLLVIPTQYLNDGAAVRLHVLPPDVEVYIPRYQYIAASLVPVLSLAIPYHHADGAEVRLHVLPPILIIVLMIIYYNTITTNLMWICIYPHYL